MEPTLIPVGWLQLLLMVLCWGAALLCSGYEAFRLPTSDMSSLHMVEDETVLSLSLIPMCWCGWYEQELLCFSNAAVYAARNGREEHISEKPLCSGYFFSSSNAFLLLIHPHIGQ